MRVTLYEDYTYDLFFIANLGAAGLMFHAKAYGRISKWLYYKKPSYSLQEPLNY